MNDYKNTVMITNPKQLDDFLESIKDEKILFIDTEFHREKTYYASLCLIQIAAGDKLAAIDPIMEHLNLTPLMEFLNNAEILKVFHAGKQDLEIFYKLNKNKTLTNIFDTQIAALALGLGDQIGYANLVKQLLNKSIDKSQQVANWTNRPLSEDQIEYAMYDVIYLQEIYSIMMKQLNKLKRLPLITEEMQKLEDEESLTTNLLNCYKSIKLRDKSPITITILQSLAAFREIEAQKHNKTRNNILRDEFLGYCARLKPTTIEDLELIRGVNNKIITKYGDHIIEIVRHTLSTPKDQLLQPNNEQSLPLVPSDIKALATYLIQLRPKENDISIKLITDSTDLTLFLASHKNPSKLRESWRWEMVGKDLELLKQGKLLLGVKGKNIITVINE